MFEWALDGRFLIQRTEVPLPGAPDSLAIVAFLAVIARVRARTQEL
jgi:hypothetical protein